MKKEAAAEGLVAIPYENAHGQYSRIIQLVKLLLFCPSSGLVSCPVAMSDGAASVLSKRKDAAASPQNSEWLKKLISRDPTAWTSGQWMT